MSSSILTSPEYCGNRLEIFTAFFVPLQIICVALRFYARYTVQASFGIDDWLVGVSLCLQMVMAGIGVSDVRVGSVGYHVAYLEEVHPERVVIFFKYLVAISSLYFISVCVPKLAICAMYKRLFPQKSVRYILYVTVGILISFTIVGTTVNLAACRPFSAQWGTLEVQTANCIDKEALFIWSSIPSIVTDVILLVLPLPIIWNLHSTTRLKIALTATFLVGSFGLVTSVMRFHTFFSKNAFTDATFTAVPLVIWTETEAGVYLICACLPTYRSLLERIGVTRLTATLPYTRSRPTGKLSGFKGTGNNISHPRSLDPENNYSFGQATASYAYDGNDSLKSGSKRSRDEHSDPPQGAIQVTTSILHSENRRGCV